MNGDLIRAFDYYLAHQDDLVEKYDGKFIVIRNDTVLGAYGDEATAIRETTKTHAIGTFLVQRVSPGDTAYTQTFHSRVVFA